jgi:long-subunit acyl-CoA synthetase (AMP-forming)
MMLIRSRSLLRNICKKTIDSRKFFSAITQAIDRVILNSTDVVKMQHQTAIEYKDRELFGTRVGDKFEWMTYAEFGKQVQLFRNVLAHHKIGKNDKVAVISNNRVEWAVAMYAVAGVGGQLVPMYVYD